MGRKTLAVQGQERWKGRRSWGEIKEGESEEETKDDMDERLEASSIDRWVPGARTMSRSRTVSDKRWRWGREGEERLDQHRL